MKIFQERYALCGLYPYGFYPGAKREKLFVGVSVIISTELLVIPAIVFPVSLVVGEPELCFFHVENATVYLSCR